MPEPLPAVDIEREIRNLNALLEVSKAISSEVQLEKLLHVIVQKTIDAMEADLAIININAHSTPKGYRRQSQN